MIRMLHKESILPRNKAHGCYCGGIANWRVAIVHYVAKAVGLHIRLEGMPLGTARNLEHSGMRSKIFYPSGDGVSYDHGVSDYADHLRRLQDEQKAAEGTTRPTPLNSTAVQPSSLQ